MLDEWNKVQIKVFSRWCAKKLLLRKIEFTTITEDFRDGVKLCSLVEILGGTRITSCTSSPKNIFQKKVNVQSALNFLDNEMELYIGDITAVGIANGDIKMTINLIMILVSKFYKDDGQILLNWCRDNTKEFKDIVNFADYMKSLNDGIALAALIAHLMPNKITPNFVRNMPRQCWGKVIEVFTNLGISLFDNSDIKNIKHEIIYYLQISTLKDYVKNPASQLQLTKSLTSSSAISVEDRFAAARAQIAAKATITDNKDVKSRNATIQPLSNQSLIIPPPSPMVIAPKNQKTDVKPTFSSSSTTSADSLTKPVSIENNVSAFQRRMQESKQAPTRAQSCMVQPSAMNDSVQKELEKKILENKNLRNQVTELEKKKEKIGEEIEDVQKTNNYKSEEILKFEKKLKELDNKILSIEEDKKLANDTTIKNQKKVKLLEEKVNKLNEARNSSESSQSGKIVETDINSSKSAKTNRSFSGQSNFKTIGEVTLEMVNNKRFTKIRDYGRGGSASVVQVLDTLTKKIYARKKFYQSNVNSREQLDREYQILSKIHHPCILHTIGYSIKPYQSLYLEFCPIDFSKALKANILTDTMKARIILEICFGMNYIHHCGIVHRDLKTENVMLTETFQVRICDFGLSRILIDSHAQITTNEGTHLYMAPELFNNDKTESKFEIDVYAFGIVLYFVIYNEPPQMSFRNKMDGKIIECPRDERYYCNYDVHPVEDLIKKCCENYFADRPTFEDIIEYMKNIEFKILPNVDSKFILHRYNQLKNYQEINPPANFN